MSKHLLFVYGTLRRGGENEITRNYPNAVYAGDASVMGRLFDMGGYPAIVLDDEAASVIGEVYEIDDATLGKLDSFELDADYRRTPIDVEIHETRRSCWIYVPPAVHCARKPEILSGDWIKYRRDLSR